MEAQSNAEKMDEIIRQHSLPDTDAIQGKESSKVEEYVPPDEVEVYSKDVAPVYIKYSELPEAMKQGLNPTDPDLLEYERKKTAAVPEDPVQEVTEEDSERSFLSKASDYPAAAIAGVNRGILYNLPYEKAVDVSGITNLEESNKRLEQEYPVTYGAGNIVGSVISPFNKLMVPVEAGGYLYGKASSLGRSALEWAKGGAKGAALGEAGEGARTGRPVMETFAKMPVSVAEGAALGGALGAGAHFLMNPSAVGRKRDLTSWIKSNEDESIAMGKEILKNPNAEESAAKLATMEYLLKEYAPPAGTVADISNVRKNIEIGKKQTGEHLNTLISKNPSLLPENLSPEKAAHIDFEFNAKRNYAKSLLGEDSYSVNTLKKPIEAIKVLNNIDLKRPAFKTEVVNQIQNTVNATKQRVLEAYATAQNPSDLQAKMWEVRKLFDGDIRIITGEGNKDLAYAVYSEFKEPVRNALNNGMHEFLNIAAEHAKTPDLAGEFINMAKPVLENSAYKAEAVKGQFFKYRANILEAEKTLSKIEKDASGVVGGIRTYEAGNENAAKILQDKIDALNREHEAMHLGRPSTPNAEAEGLKAELEKLFNKPRPYADKAKQAMESWQEAAQRLKLVMRTAEADAEALKQAARSEEARHLDLSRSISEEAANLAKFSNKIPAKTPGQDAADAAVKNIKILNKKYSGLLLAEDFLKTSGNLESPSENIGARIGPIGGNIRVNKDIFMGPDLSTKQGKAATEFIKDLRNRETVDNDPRSLTKYIYDKLTGQSKVENPKTMSLFLRDILRRVDPATGELIRRAITGYQSGSEE